MYFLFIHLVSLPVSRYTSTVFTIEHYSTLFIAAISIEAIVSDIVSEQL